MTEEELAEALQLIQHARLGDRQATGRVVNIVAPRLLRELKRVQELARSYSWVGTWHSGSPPNTTTGSWQSSSPPKTTTAS
jgi:hypothetical protein